MKSTPIEWENVYIAIAILLRGDQECSWKGFHIFATFDDKIEIYPTRKSIELKVNKMIIDYRDHLYENFDGKTLFRFVSKTEQKADDIQASFNIMAQHHAVYELGGISLLFKICDAELATRVWNELKDCIMKNDLDHNTYTLNCLQVKKQNSCWANHKLDFLAYGCEEDCPMLQYPSLFTRKNREQEKKRGLEMIDLLVA